VDYMDVEVEDHTMTWPSDSPTCGSTDDRMADDVVIGGRLWA
jgi:hypothetical protein